MDNGKQTLVFASDGGIPYSIYWGSRLPKNELLDQIGLSDLNDLTSSMMDKLPDISLCPESSVSFQGQPGLVIFHPDGTQLRPSFNFKKAEISLNSLRFICTSEQFQLTLLIKAQKTGVFSLQTLLESDEPVRLHWLAAPVLPGSQASNEMIDFHGKWTREFQPNRIRWTPGIRQREAINGRSGHEHPPFLIVPERGCTNSKGTAFAFHYAWSGGHRMVAEELPDGRRQIQFGNVQGAEPHSATHFETAELIVGYSEDGLNGVAVSFQKDFRDRIVTWPNPKRPRPVHYNCWEAVYFEHNLKDLMTIADKVAKYGAERFILDDGWFEKRNNDKTSLGDWRIDSKKWPLGFEPLISHIHKLGMTFGIWFEPEMVSNKSELFRLHPEWVLGNIDQTTGRYQLILDMSRTEVRDYIFEAISMILSTYPIDYIKWDHNRTFPFVDTSQTRGTYELLDRLRIQNPSLEIESCASGGGRIDAGILSRTHRIWLSDSNDALERLRIHHEASLFLPSCITGAHVGPRHSHTSGRRLPISFRAWVAAQRHMGFEMDPRELGPDEEETLIKITSWYKNNRSWMMSGTIQRLDTDDSSVIAEIQISENNERFVVFVGQAEMSSQILPRPLRLTGLDPVSIYEINLLNPEDRDPRSRGFTALKKNSLTLSGRALMSKGINLPLAWPCTMLVLEASKQQDPSHEA